MLTFDELKEKVTSWAAMNDLEDQVTVVEGAQGVMLKGVYPYHRFHPFERFCDSIGAVYHGVAEGLWALLPGATRPGILGRMNAATPQRREPQVLARHPFDQPLPTVAPRPEWQNAPTPALVTVQPQLTEQMRADVDHFAEAITENVREYLTVTRPMREPVLNDIAPVTERLQYAANGHPVEVGDRVDELADGPGEVMDFERDFVVVRHDNGQTMYYLPHDFAGTAVPRANT